MDVENHHSKMVNIKWQSRDSFRLNGFFDDIDIHANNSALIKQMFVEPLVEVNQAYFIADDPHKRERPLLGFNSQSKITQELAGLVSQARESIYIQTPYLVLTSPAISLFKSVFKQYPNIDIRISTNSLAATDSWYVYALSYKQKKTYLDELNFKIYEFKPRPYDLRSFMPSYDSLKDRVLIASRRKSVKQVSPGQMQREDMSPFESPSIRSTRESLPYFCMHGKSLVVDEEVSFIGSYNLDPRSENINTESGLVIRDKNLSQMLRGQIERDMKPRNSWVIARKDRPVVVDETNALLVELSNLIPLIDIWPFRYSASFELREGKPIVGTEHPDFYDNYKDVGSFPQARDKGFGKEIGARGTKAFLSFVKPLL
jgi:phosphatidylserine/phosphatidylglycerophosphate/cardiolipin synthase-like enzyme